jgi:hypothetical protein
VLEGSLDPLVLSSNQFDFGRASLTSSNEVEIDPDNKPSGTLETDSMQEPSPMRAMMPKPAGGTELFMSSMNVTCKAMEVTGHAFVTIGASMDVQRWNWPGYLTFYKGVSSKTAPQDQPAADATEKTSEEKPAEASPDSVAGLSVSPGPDLEAGLQGEVDTESLHEAKSTDGRELLHREPPLEEENGSAVDLTSPTEERDDVADVAQQAASDSVQDEQDPPPPLPSTPIVCPPNLTTLLSLSSSQSTIHPCPCTFLRIILTTFFISQ